MKYWVDITEQKRFKMDLHSNNDLKDSHIYILNQRHWLVKSMISKVFGFRGFQHVYLLSRKNYKILK